MPHPEGGRTPIEPMPRRHLVQQAGQIAEGDVRLGVFRTLADEGGAYAVLRLRREGSAEVIEVEARAGTEVEVEGIGLLDVLEILPSAPRRRGAVLLELARSGQQDEAERLGAPVPVEGESDG